jgi:hypothetical protein
VAVPSTIDRLTHHDEPSGAAIVRRRRWLHRATLGGLSAILVVGVLDAADVFDAYGVDEGRVQAVGDGVTLVVEYPSVTRPALASPFRVRVERPEGFDAPVILAVSRPWIEIWDENGLYPSPSAETGDGRWVEWEFDPPDGTVFTVFYDARLEPARQQSAEGTVELRDVGGDVLAAVTFETRVRP